jgi:transposase
LEDPTPEQVARFDRKRKKRTSNQDWVHPHDPDARVTRMKDGRTHLAHKAEHAVDLETGAVVAVTLQAADLGDTTTIRETLREAQRSVQSVGNGTLTEAVTDKGYHSASLLKQLHEQGIRTYIAEPERGKQKWKGKEVEQRCVYANRRRLRGKRGKQLQLKRAELVERPFAHMYDTGGMRRVYLRGRRNILKRVLVQGAGVNLALVMRTKYGAGKPRQAHGQKTGFRGGMTTLLRLWQSLIVWFRAHYPLLVGRSESTSAQDANLPAA